MLHRINIYYFKLYLFLTIYYFIFKLIMLIKSGILLKNHVCCKYAKILHHTFIPTIYENYKLVFFLIYDKRKLSNLYESLIWAIERCTAWKVSVFGVILVRIFPHSDWIQRYTLYLSLFSPKARKYEPEWLRIRTLFTQWYIKKTKGKKLKTIDPSQFYHLSLKFMENIFKSLWLLL